jgi:hypothetical protein
VDSGKDDDVRDSDSQSPVVPSSAETWEGVHGNGSCDIPSTADDNWEEIMIDSNTKGCDIPPDALDANSSVDANGKHTDSDTLDIGSTGR